MVNSCSHSHYFDVHNVVNCVIWGANRVLSTVWYLPLVLCLKRVSGMVLGMRGMDCWAFLHSLEARNLDNGPCLSPDANCPTSEIFLAARSFT